MPTRVIFDTNAYSHLFRGNTDCAEVLQRSPRIGISVVVMAELLSGLNAAIGTLKIQRGSSNF